MSKFVVSKNGLFPGLNFRHVIFVAVFGGLDLHGIERTPVQTTLASTANAGATQITLKHDVDWKVRKTNYLAVYNLYSM